MRAINKQEVHGRGREFTACLVGATFDGYNDILNAAPLKIRPKLGLMVGIDRV